MTGTRVPVTRPGKVAHEILAVIAGRWSPRAIDPRPVERDKLLRLLEAARWAASCYNEQPWRFFLALQDEPHRPLFESLLVEGNAWAKRAPALVLAAASTRFARTGKPNPTAVHDVGLASATLQLQAVAEGLVTHGMAGFDAARARTELRLPDEVAPVAMWAIGYPGFLEDLPEARRAAEAAERTRRPLAETVFTNVLGQTHPLCR